MFGRNFSCQRCGVLWAFAPLFLWAGVIFFLSSNSGSSEQTSRFIRPLLEWLFSSSTPETIDLYHLLIRKAAHLTEYAILAFLACRTYASVFNLSRTATILAAIVTALAVATTDEFNQSFNTARTSSPWDVALDVTGGVIGAIVFTIIYRNSRKNAS